MSDEPVLVAAGGHGATYHRDDDGSPSCGATAGTWHTRPIEDARVFYTPCSLCYDVDDTPPLPPVVAVATGHPETFHRLDEDSDEPRPACGEHAGNYSRRQRRNVPDRLDPCSVCFPRHREPTARGSGRSARELRQQLEQMDADEVPP